MVGQQNLRESLLIGLLAGGHILIESVPGLAKTTAARVVAESIHGGFQRIQCTPDLLPSDIIGTQIYESATNSFVTQLGPVHTNIVLLDEINRSSAKTQSAMLEAMEERQTTIAGTVLPDSGAVPGDRHPEPGRPGRHLPPLGGADRPVHAQGRPVVSLPGRRGRGDGPDGRRAVRQGPPQQAGRRPGRCAAAAGHRAPRLHGPGADALRERTGRRDPHSRRGTCPASSPGSSSTAPAHAPPSRSAKPRAHWQLLSGRAHVIPDDIAKLAHRVLRHRLILGFEAASNGVTPEVVIDAVLQAVRVP